MNRRACWKQINSVTAAGLSVLLALALMASGPAPAAGDEARCAWFSRFEWGTRQDIVDEIANIADCNMNAVLFQIRGEADAFYISQWEPWAEPLGGNYPGYDPLAVAIYEAHKRGLELHAYVNTFPAWSDTSAPLSPFHIYRTHPEWIMVDAAKVPMDPGTTPYGYAFVSPGIPQVREHINKVIMDIVTNYDVDGIHLDYIRYPATAYSHDDSSLARFAREYPGCTPSTCVTYWSPFRRSLVDEVVEATYDSVTALKPWVKVSAAVWGWWSDGFNNYLQDSHGWLEDGIVDFTAPMIYVHNTSTYQSRLHDHAVAKYGRHVYGGIGLYLGLYVDTLLTEISTCRSEGVEGQAIFSATDLYGEYKTTLTGVGGPYEVPDSLPPMAWKASKPFAVSVALPVSSTQVDVLFSADVDLTTGEDTDNYVFDSGLLTLSATRDAIDHRLVHLTTSTHYDDFLYTLTVTGVQSDGSKEIVAWPNDRRQFYGKSTYPPPGIIVDNEDGAPAFTYVGYWRQSVSGECYNNTKHYHARGGGDSTATWTTAIDSSGNYAVFYWVNYSNYTADAHYIINTVAGPDSAIGDQYYEERWNYLGTFPFSDTARVTVTNYFTTGTYVIADAIQWLYVSPLSSGAPPAAVTDLQSCTSGADIALIWSAVTVDTLGQPDTVSGYVIYRNSDPASLPADSIGTTVGTAYTDPGAAGSTATNYFYVVRAVNEAKNKSAASNLVGEFDRQLIASVKGAAAKKTGRLQ